jgi:hypothetical protein
MAVPAVEPSRESMTGPGRRREREGPLEAKASRIPLGGIGAEQRRREKGLAPVRPGGGPGREMTGGEGARGGLPRLLAVAAAAVLVAGTSSALALTGAGSSPAAARAPVGISGVESLAETARPRPDVALAGPGASTLQSPPATAGAGPSVLQSLAGPAADLPVTVEPGAAPAAPDPAGRPAVSLPTPTASTLPTVSGLAHDLSPSAVVLLDAPLTPAQTAGLSHLSGVTNIETVDTGTVTMGGAPVVAFGVDPGSFRNFAPPASAASDSLWRYLAGGALVSSYTMADDRNLALGSTQSIVPSASAPYSSVSGWLGAFASIGLPGVDLLVDHQYSADLGLIPDSGLVVVAPGLPGGELQTELERVLPAAAVELLSPTQLPTDLPGDTLSASARQQIVAAALSRLGLPYLWGGSGPSSFDCSGLVQWAYRQAGIAMPRVADEQFLTGDHIPLADAQPGDLLFWAYDPNDPGYIDHVAIYLGNGLMVVAPHTGTDVEIAPVDTAGFAGAVQVVLASGTH